MLDHREIAGACGLRSERLIEECLVVRTAAIILRMDLQIRPESGEVHKGRVDVGSMLRKILIRILLHVPAVLERRIHNGGGLTEDPTEIENAHARNEHSVFRCSQ
jgi:hypothetical protein